jgi:hypothetical protein
VADVGTAALALASGIVGGAIGLGGSYLASRSNEQRARGTRESEEQRARDRLGFERTRAWRDLAADAYVAALHAAQPLHARHTTMDEERAKSLIADAHEAVRGLERLSALADNEAVAAKARDAAELLDGLQWRWQQLRQDQSAGTTDVNDLTHDRLAMVQEYLMGVPEFDDRIDAYTNTGGMLDELRRAIASAR